MKTTPIETHQGLDVKRDDLYGTTPNLGAKVRSARRLLGELRPRPKGVVAFGGTVSNHIRVTAWTAREIGLPCVIVHPAQSVTANLALARDAGAELVAVPYSRLPELAAVASQVARERGFFMVPWGLKCREAIVAMKEEADTVTTPYDHVVLTCGTGVSAVGVLESIRARDLSTTVWAVCIGRSSRRVRRSLASVADLRDGRLRFINLGNFGAGAETLPPFPCDPHYDARVWEHIPRLDLHGRVLFWNLGAAPEYLLDLARKK